MSGVSTGKVQTGAIGYERLQKITHEKIQKKQVEIARLDEQTKAYTERDEKIKDLHAALQSLTKTDNVYARLVDTGTKDSPTLSATVSAGASLGKHTFTIQSLATASQLQGVADKGGVLYTQDVSSSSNDSGPLLSALPLVGLTAGTLSINGQTITVSFADDLQTFFQAIEAATSGDILASYNTTTDKFTLTSQTGQDIILGAPNDTSNFWQAAWIGSKAWNSADGPRPATLSTTSSLATGTVNLNPAIANSHLKNAASLTTGDQTLTINGKMIAYNVANDSISNLMQKIEQSGSAAQLIYNRSTDSFILQNQATGALGIACSDTGNLLSALGLGSGVATLTLGANAQFKVDGATTLSYPSNTLDESAHGIKGLSIALKNTGTESINIKEDPMRTKEALESLIKSYNAFVDFAADKTKSLTVNGKAIQGLLANDQTLRSLLSAVRQKLFVTQNNENSVVKNANALGISGSKNIQDPKLTLDTAQLEKNIASQPTEVAAFINILASELDTPLQPYTNPSSRGLSLDQIKTPQQQNNDRKAKIQQEIAKLQKEYEDFVQKFKVQEMQIEALGTKYQADFAALNNLPSFNKK